MRVYAAPYGLRNAVNPDNAKLHRAGPILSKTDHSKLIERE